MVQSTFTHTETNNIDATKKRSYLYRYEFRRAVCTIVRIFCYGKKYLMCVCMNNIIYYEWIIFLVTVYDYISILLYFFIRYTIMIQIVVYIQNKICKYKNQKSRVLYRLLFFSSFNCILCSILKSCVLLYK